MQKINWKKLSDKYKKDILKIEDYYLENIYNKDNLLEFLVIIHNYQVIGYISYKEYSDIYDIYNVGVNKFYRNQGLATTMFLELENKDIYLEVNEINTKGLNLYKKLGFIKIKEIENYYKDGNKAYVMYKKNKMENYEI